MIVGSAGNLTAACQESADALASTIPPPFSSSLSASERCLHMNIPKNMQPTIDAWVNHGVPHPQEMGSFLRCVLTNDLLGAVAHADDANRDAIVSWAMYLYNEVPALAHGNMQRLVDWAARGGLSGKRAA